MLKPYYYKVGAVKITRKNYEELKKLDEGDGCLNLLTEEEALGEWFVYSAGGFEIWSNSITLIPAPD